MNGIINHKNNKKMKEFKQSELTVLSKNKTFFVPFMGELTESKPVKTNFKKTGVTEWGESLYDVETEFANGACHFYVNGFDKVYSSKSDFENGCPTKAREQFSFEDIAGAPGTKLCWHLLGYKFNTLKYWVVDNSSNSDQFVEKELPMNNFWYDYENDKWGNDDMPTCDYYTSRENAISWSSYNLNLADGTSKEVIGHNKLLKLDEDQKELVEKFKSIIQQLKDADVVIQTNLCDTIFAYNKRNVAEIETCYENIADDGYELCDGWNKIFEIATVIECSEDFDVWIKRKEEK